jgi:hypothetical protein
MDGRGERQGCPKVFGWVHEYVYMPYMYFYIHEYKHICMAHPDCLCTFLMAAEGRLLGCITPACICTPFAAEVCSLYRLCALLESADNCGSSSFLRLGSALPARLSACSACCTLPSLSSLCANMTRASALRFTVPTNTSPCALSHAARASSSSPVYLCVCVCIYIHIYHYVCVCIYIYIYI